MTSVSDSDTDLDSVPLRERTIRSQLEFVSSSATRAAEMYEEEDEQTKERGPPPVKTTLTALFLLIVGLVFTIGGLSFLFTAGPRDERTVPFLVIGGIAILPGSYASTILLLAWLGRPGFSYDQLPTYDY
jgi:hypothetical protein